MIYVIHGPDRLLARESVLAIATEIDPDGENTSWLDGREVAIERIAAAVGTTSFFGAPRVVIVSELLARATREADVEGIATVDETQRSRGKLALDALISAVPEQNCLIFFEPSLNSVPAVFKSAAPGATIIAGDPPRGAALIAWIESAALRFESRIDRAAAQRLAETLFPQTWDRKPNNPRYDRPPNLALLSREIEKLSLAAHPNQITSEHIETLTPGGPDPRVFRFLDAALVGDLRSALTELERLSAAGEEPAMLLAQILGQVELATVAEAADSRNADAVARDFASVTPGRIAAVMASTRRQFPRRPGHAAQTGVETDRKLKTGRVRNPEDALHDFVLAVSAAASAPTIGRSR